MERYKDEGEQRVAEKKLRPPDFRSEEDFHAWVEGKLDIGEQAESVDDLPPQFSSDQEFDAWVKGESSSPSTS